MTLSSIRYHILLLVLAASAPAQSGRAELFGIIHDPSALSVSGATCELTEDHTALKYKTTTDPDGAYHFYALPPGEYTLTIRKPGFTALRRTGIVLDVASRTALDLSLAVGDVQTTVDVSATAPLLDTTTGATSFLVDSAKTHALPLDGR